MPTPTLTRKSKARAQATTPASDDAPSSASTADAASLPTHRDATTAKAPASPSLPKGLNPRSVLLSAISLPSYIASAPQSTPPAGTEALSQPSSIAAPLVQPTAEVSQASSMAASSQASLAAPSVHRPTQSQSSQFATPPPPPSVAAPLIAPSQSTLLPQAASSSSSSSTQQPSQGTSQSLLDTEPKDMAADALACAIFSLFFSPPLPFADTH